MSPQENVSPQENAETLGRSIKDSVVHLAETQKEAGAQQLSGIAGAVHAAADELTGQLPGAAGYIHEAAGQIDNAAADLRTRSLSDLTDGVRRLGQERPLALFGGAVLAGFVLSRFLRSAETSDRREDSARGQ